MDFETTNLSAAFGVILCGVVKPAYGKPRIFRADRLNPRSSSTRSDDSHVLRAIVGERDRHDVWIIHNGVKLAGPFLRTRPLRRGLPALGSKKFIDPVSLARGKLPISY